MTFGRRSLSLLSLAFLWCAVPSAPALAQQETEGLEPGPTTINKGGREVDERSLGRVLADEAIANGGVILADELSPVPGQTVVPQIKSKGGNLQVNAPGLDHTQVFDLFRPFLFATQSETSIAASGRTIVSTYNSSAGTELVELAPGVLAYSHLFFSGYSVSNDGGKSWTSGFFPPLPGSIFTFGDPAVDVDRHGNFYFACLGADADGNSTIQVNHSTDGGRTWSDAVLVQQDDGGDKEWIAVGKDPNVKSRDNVYVTWTSFQASGGQLRFGRSIDGGKTFTSKTIYAPPPDPNDLYPQNALQFSNPYVDPITGTLYVPFLHFSNADQDFIQVLASDDAGDTFHFLEFNVPGAPDPTLLPVTQPGEYVDAGSGGGRLAIHAGPALAGRSGLRQFVQTARLVLQPAFAARNGVLYLAWSNSTSSSFGDPGAGSNVLFVRSDDGGQTWTTPAQANPTVPSDVQHVLPSLAIDNDPNDVHIAYYTQHADESVDVDMVNSHDRGSSFPAGRTVRVTSTNFVLPPTVVRLGSGPTPTTNYDRVVVSGYSLGEYLSVKSANGTVYALWGDCRNSITHPINPLDPLSGQTHSQQDVFFQAVKAQ
jgi:hypothetical protein